MKANKKSGGLKGLLLNHCEKAGIFFFALVAGWLVYSSLGVESETRKPNQLTTAVQQTRNAFQDSDLADVPEGEYLPADSIGAQEEVVISPEAYPNVRGLNTPVVPPTIDRVDPPLLAAVDLEVNAVTGLMAFVDEDIRRQREIQAAKERAELDQERERERERGDDPLGRLGGRGQETLGRGLDEGDGKRRPVSGRIRQGGVMPQGDERIMAVSAAIVLAKAPILDQYNTYKEALEGARDYDAQGDAPRYFGYYVQRAEVVEGAEPTWQKVAAVGMTGGDASPIVSQSAIDTIVEDWAAAQEPLVDARFEHPSMTFPLPPLVGKPWGSEVVHSEAPLQSETDAKEAEEAELGEDEDLDEDASDEDPESRIFSRGLDDTRERGARGGGRSGGMRGGMRGGEFGGMRGAPRSFSGGEGEYSGGEGGYSRGGGRSARRSGGGEFTISEDVPFAMVRFFDHTVKPGKRYRYRVRLILEDVNHGVDERALAREVIERRESLKGSRKLVRFADWSEASPIVTIPQAGDAYVAGVKPASARQANAEGRVSFLLQSYALNDERPPRAIQVALEEDFQRGGVLNVTKDAEFITPDRRWIEERDSFPFRTGVTLIDYDGGETITRDISTPGRVLLMDSGGRLFVRHELDDAEQVTIHESLFKGEDSGGGFRGGRGGESFGFEGGRGGF